MARLKGFQKLVSVDWALQTFLEKLQISLRTTQIALHSALTMILAEDVIAGADLPRTDRSAVDGYAVEAEDAFGATQLTPKILKLVRNDRMGKNKAVEIWTGNPMPRHADAVVMLENTKLIGEKIQVWSPVARWENVSRQAEDVKKGEVLIEIGTRLRPQHLGLACALGVARVKVFERPMIAVLATGNELAPLGARLSESQIFDSNRLVLSALCSELGAEILDLGIAKDDADEISEKLKLGLEKADAIITSGGTSVGGPDLVPEAVNRVGEPGIIVHGVAMRPGMPTALAVVKGKPVLILPGNPVAAMLGFEVFGRPLLCRMLGLKQIEQRPVLEARMTRRITTTLGRKNLVRVHVFRRNKLFAEPISARGSSLMSTMTKSNGFVVVPENVEGLEKGEIVSVHMFDNLDVVDRHV